MTDARLADEPARLAALDRYCVLDTGREAAFDKITTLVRTVLDVPICAVSLIDAERQWFKSIQGLDAAETPRRVAFCHHTIQSRDPFVVPDATADPRFAQNPLVTGAPDIRSYAGVPLKTPDGYNLGALCAIDTRPRQFTEAQIGILQTFAALVMDELELRTIAHQDHLTGALTRRALIERAHELDRWERYGRSCSLVLFDIDHFKSINDRFGHPAGDAVLRAVSEACRAMLRPTDSFGRIGGEEFALLLPETNLRDALVCAERTREHIAALPPVAEGMPTITASFGVAEPEGADVDAWLAAADRWLYAAKRNGRNRCAADLEIARQAAA